MAHTAFQYAFLATCLPSFAVYHAYKAQVMRYRIAQEFKQQLACRITLETV